MQITPGIKIIDLALYLEKEKILIIADLHIGLEEAMNKEGVFVPRFQLKEIMQRLKKILSNLAVKKIIINGDIKHEFGTISDQEWRDTLKVLDYLSEKAAIILIKGNHDTILGPIAEKRNVKITDYYKINDITILHGHKIIPAALSTKTLIIAHEHPAISFRERRDEKFKCFLKGKWKNKILIVQPSFNFVVEGTDIKKEALLSPFLQKNLENFECFIVEDKIYKFGKLENIK